MPVRVKDGNLFMRRAMDSYNALCSLYGECNAQLLMKVRGACNPIVAQLAIAMGRSLAAVRAAREYRRLTSLPGGYMRLMTACRNDGAVKRLIATIGQGHRYSPWEIDTAVAVLLAALDAQIGSKTV